MCCSCMAGAAAFPVSIQEAQPDGPDVEPRGVGPVCAVLLCIDVFVWKVGTEGEVLAKDGDC